MAGPLHIVLPVASPRGPKSPSAHAAGEKSRGFTRTVLILSIAAAATIGYVADTFLLMRPRSWAQNPMLAAADFPFVQRAALLPDSASQDASSSSGHGKIKTRNDWAYTRLTDALPALAPSAFSTSARSAASGPSAALGAAADAPAAEAGSSARRQLADISADFSAENKPAAVLDAPAVGAGAAGVQSSAVEGGPAGDLPLILAITATHARASQELYFTRLVSTLRQVAGPLKWIVVESPGKTEETASLLKRTAGLCLPLGSPNCRRIDYVHLGTGQEETAKHNSAVGQRNRGLDYIEEKRMRGVVYIMDDDNTYSPQLFEEIRRVKRVGTLPVGLLQPGESFQIHRGWPTRPVVEGELLKRGGGGGGGAEPVVLGGSAAERLVNWAWGKKPTSRTSNVDMAGFAFRSELLWEGTDAFGFPKRPLRFEPVQRRFLEKEFLKKLVLDNTSLEPLADKRTDVLVWHVHSET